MESFDEEHPRTRIEDLTPYSRSVYALVKVISKTEQREVTSRRDDSQHRVCEALVADDTGSVYLTLWDDAIDNIDEDSFIKVENGYVNVFRGSMRLNIGRYGEYEVLDEKPWSDDDLNLDNNLSSRQVEYNRRGRGGYRRDRRPRRDRRY